MGFSTFQLGCVKAHSQTTTFRDIVKSKYYNWFIYDYPVLTSSHIIKKLKEADGNFL